MMQQVVFIDKHNMITCYVLDLKKRYFNCTLKVKKLSVGNMFQGQYIS